MNGINQARLASMQLRAVNLIVRPLKHALDARECGARA
jgi:hypothetical protein